MYINNFKILISQISAFDRGASLDLDELNAKNMFNFVVLYVILLLKGGLTHFLFTELNTFFLC